MLTNDPIFWNPKTHGRATNADAFRIEDGRSLTGLCEWGEMTGGTKRGREDSLTINGTYRLAWKEFSDLPGATGRFRYLAIEVPNRIS